LLKLKVVMSLFRSAPAFLFAPLLFAQTGVTVEGTVVNRVTHQGVSGVSVTLDRGTAGLAYRAVTDSSGAFRILNVDPGDYLPTFEKRGLSVVDSSSKPLQIGAAAGPIHLRAEMLPWTRIGGHVLDAEDHPIPRVRVALVPLRAGRGSIGTFATTDDAGAFTLATEPGMYRLLADPYQSDGLRRGGLGVTVAPTSAPSAAASATAAPRAWAPTYYPATADPQAAQPISISAGADLSGFDVHLQAVPLFHIRGVVVDTRGVPAAGLALKLVPPPANWWEPEETEVNSTAGGAFDFAHVRPGDWHVIAEVERGDASLMGFAPARVQAADVSGVKVHLTEPFTVQGRVEGAKAGNNNDLCETTSVSLISTEVAQDTSGEAQENGLLRIPEVYPGRYKVQVCGIPQGHYLASVLVGERDVLGQEFTLAPGAVPLRVVFKSDGGTVRGTVAEGEGMAVALVPADEALLDPLFVATTTAGEGGRFELGNLRPGEYHAFAFDRIGDPDALSDPIFVRSLAGQSTTVRVEHGRAASVDLKVVRWPE
jgi:hypothetical protein